MYNERNTKLYRKRFSIESCDAEHVSIWNIAPVWPGRSKAKLSAKQLADLMDGAFSRSADHGHLVLWMPASELHQTPFDPLDMCGPWIPSATILSGSAPLHIGFVYSRSRSKASWETKLILDERGKRGPSSSLTVKFMLENLGDVVGPIVDPFAHSSAILPKYARIQGFRYVGYTASKKAYREIANKLAQVELPGIQLEVPA